MNSITYLQLIFYRFCLKLSLILSVITIQLIASNERNITIKWKTRQTINNYAYLIRGFPFSIA